jgi:hypothetical protein
MFEAIVTLVFPATSKLVPGTGALLSRDHIEEVEPAHTEVIRIEFDTKDHMMQWLDTDDHEGIVAAQKMGQERWEAPKYSEE